MGDNHSCALSTAGAVSCWGANALGQSDVPADLETATALAAGGNFTCAVEVDGDVTCWGEDDMGQSSPSWNLQTGFVDAPFGYERSGNYAFETQCSNGGALEYRMPAGETSPHLLEPGCY